MEDTATIFLVITIAAAVLQIILFFKVWAMTNDVRKIRDQLLNINRGEARKHIVLGDKEKAKEVLLAAFFKGIEEDDYAKFIALKSQLERDFKEIGEEIPDGIKKLESTHDYMNVLKSYQK